LAGQPAAGRLVLAGKDPRTDYFDDFPYL